MRSTALIILVTLLLTATACLSKEPAKPPTNSPANVTQDKEKEEADASVRATVEAETAHLESDSAIQTRVAEAVTDVTNPSPTEPPDTTESERITAISVQDCDQLLRNQLAFQTGATNAGMMQEVIRQIQTQRKTCAAQLWNPVVSNPTPGEEGTCLSKSLNIRMIEIPGALKTPDGNRLRPTSGVYDEGNVIVHWSTDPAEKPTDGSVCWMYIAEADTWLTDRTAPKIYTLEDAFDFEVGDCITPEESTATGSIRLNKTPCNGEWTYRVLKKIELTEGPYPGKRQLESEAFHKCGPRFSFMDFPNELGWRQGSRTITCMEKSFGLSVTNPEKLNRLARKPSLTTGDCFNDAPETNSRMAELVGCNEHWEERVLNTFELQDAKTRPTLSEIRRESVARCDRRYTHTQHPIEHTWAWGDRTVQCLQANVTGETGISRTLDNLVNTLLLNPGECAKLDDDIVSYLALLTDCDSPDWDLRVKDRTSVPDSDEYPGEDALNNAADAACDQAPTTYLTPDKFLWERGHRNIICITPRSGEMLARGIALAESGQYHAALRELQRYQELFGGKSEEAETWMGFIYEDLEDYPAAIRHHSNAIRLNDSAYHRLNRAYAYINNDNITAAADDAKKTLARTPDAFPGYHSEAEANWIIAIFEQGQGNVQKALQHANRAKQVALENGYDPEELRELEGLIATLATTSGAENERDGRTATAPPKRRTARSSQI